MHTGGTEADTVLVEVSLPGQIRSHQDAYGVHPALLDACFQSVAAHPRVQVLGDDALALPLGIRRLQSCASSRNARYCYTRVTRADASGVEADLDVLDDNGSVLLAARGLRLGAEASTTGHDERVLAKRLLTVEWSRRALPDAECGAGSWLLITTAPDGVATSLPDAMRGRGARTVTMRWPTQSDHASNVEMIRNHLRDCEFTGVVILTGPRSGAADDQSPVLGREWVEHVTGSP